MSARPHAPSVSRRVAAHRVGPPPFPSLAPASLPSGPPPSHAPSLCRSHVVRSLCQGLAPPLRAGGGIGAGLSSLHLAALAGEAQALGAVEARASPRGRDAREWRDTPGPSQAAGPHSGPAVAPGPLAPTLPAPAPATAPTPALVGIVAVALSRAHAEAARADRLMRHVLAQLAASTAPQHVRAEAMRGAVRTRRRARSIMRSLAYALALARSLTRSLAHCRPLLTLPCTTRARPSAPASASVAAACFLSRTRMRVP